jgi:hypothetical protein
VLLLALALSASGGCAKNLGVPEYQLMESRLEQGRAFQAAPQRVLAIVADEARARESCGLLAQSDGIVSWCERASDWRDISQDAIGHKSGDNPPEKYVELARDTGEGVAVTTAHVEPHGSGTWLSARRVFYGKRSMSGVAHSRGDYEKDLYSRVASTLGETGEPR